MEFKDIQRVNRNISTTNIKGKEYAEVHQRVIAFRELEPEGRIETQIVSIESGVVIMKASAYTKGGELLATGYAYEKENSTNVNKTSYIENCETSAIGRCLGFVGLGIDTSIASAEEVANAIKQQENIQEAKKRAENYNKVQDATKPQSVVPQSLKEVQEEFKQLCAVKGFNFQSICEEFDISAKSTEQRLRKVIKELRSR